MPRTWFNNATYMCETASLNSLPANYKTKTRDKYIEYSSYFFLLTSSLVRRREKSWHDNQFVVVAIVTRYTVYWCYCVLCIGCWRRVATTSQTLVILWSPTRFHSSTTFRANVAMATVERQPRDWPDDNGNSNVWWIDRSQRGNTEWAARTRSYRAASGGRLTVEYSS